MLTSALGFPAGSEGEESPCNVGDPGSIPGEFHGQRSLASYSPWGHKQLDTIERLTHIQPQHC